MNQNHQLDFSMFQKTIKKEEQKKKDWEWCETVDENTDDGEYIFVNLQDNKESYTAYNGSHVWQTIYSENCFLDRIYSEGLDPNEVCSEETLLYQVVSGLHTSVNMHVSNNYRGVDTNVSEPNHEMFLDKIGRHSDRLKNLFFVYALAIRAINRID